MSGLIRADARFLPLRDACVQCVVTSPPYFGLRDYGTATWTGGDPSCDHKQGRPGAGRADGIVDERAQRNRDGVGSMGGDCRRCGATRVDAQIGLEPTPDAYVAALVAVFREVRRVLKDDGVLWLNMGDSYSNGGRTSQTVDTSRTRGQVVDNKRRGATSRNSDSDSASGKQEYLNGTVMRPPVIDGLGGKQLLMIPSRVAMALQSDGWYLRSDIIWHKPNPMPESVTDRPTKAHEYLFLLTKAERYYYDAKAIEEQATGQTPGNLEPYEPPGQREGKNANIGGSLHKIGPRETRNKRSVWTVPTMPYSGAHFATMPERLVEPCILAGSRVGDRVFDPFVGSGTVGAVAERLGRRWTGTDLSYQHLAADRTAQRGLQWSVE